MSEMISYDEFLAGIKKEVCWYAGKPGLEFLDVSWIIGGKEGGNCWGKSAYGIEVEPEPEFTVLHDTLLKFAPSLTFYDFTRLKSMVKTTILPTEFEYYGNCKTRSQKKILLKPLYDFLHKQGALNRKD